MYHSGCSCIACIIAVVCKRGPLVHPTAHHIFYPATERRNRGVVFLPLASRHSRDHRIASTTYDWFESWRPRGARVPPAESTTRVRGPAAGGGNNGVVPQRTPRRGETTTKKSEGNGFLPEAHHHRVATTPPIRSSPPPFKRREPRVRDAPRSDATHRSAARLRASTNHQRNRTQE